MTFRGCWGLGHENVETWRKVTSLEEFSHTASTTTTTPGPRQETRWQEFENLESDMADFFEALRRDLVKQPLGRHIVLSDKHAQWSGPTILFVYRDNVIPQLREKATILHQHGLLRPDEADFYYISEKLAKYLFNS